MTMAAPSDEGKNVAELLLRDDVESLPDDVGGHADARKEDCVDLPDVDLVLPDEDEDLDPFFGPSTPIQDLQHQLRIQLCLHCHMLAQ